MNNKKIRLSPPPDTGDEVIVQSHTHIATVNPITYQCATPILIDSEQDTWNMSPELLEKAIKDRMSNVVAGIGCGQMEVLDKRIAARRANFDFYSQELPICRSVLSKNPKSFLPIAG